LFKRGTPSPAQRKGAVLNRVQKNLETCLSREEEIEFDATDLRVTPAPREGKKGRPGFSSLGRNRKKAGFSSDGWETHILSPISRMSVGVFTLREEPLLDKNPEKRTETLTYRTYLA